MKTIISGNTVTIGNAILLAIAYIIIGIFIPAIVDVTVWRNFDVKISVWLNLVTLIVVSVGFFAYLSKTAGTQIAVFVNTTVTSVMLAAGCSLLLYLLLDSFLDPIFDRAFPISAEQYQETVDALSNAPVTAFIRVGLFAPITEEMLMRGYVLGRLKDKYGIITALIVATVLHAVLHFNFVQTLSALICGLMIGLLYIKTGSLFCCILTHALYNSLSFFSLIMR